MDDNKLKALAVKAGFRFEDSNPKELDSHYRQGMEEFRKLASDISIPILSDLSESKAREKALRDALQNLMHRTDPERAEYQDAEQILALTATAQERPNMGKQDQYWDAESAAREMDRLNAELSRVGEECNIANRACAQASKKLAESLAAIKRVERTVISMRDRATDNPQGIQSDTLAMFADELQLALKP